MGDKRGVAESAGNMGIAYYNLGHYAKAEHCYRKKMRLCQELDFKRGLSVTWINLGILYQDQGKFSKALACTRKSLRICEKLGDKRGISNCLCNIGLALYERGEFTHAGEYYDRAIQLGRQLGIKYYLNAYLYNKAKLLAATGETEAAIKVNHEALEIAREIDSQNGVFRSRTLANRLNKNVEALLDMARSETYSPDQLGIIYYTLWKLTGEKKHKQEATTLLQEIYAKIPSYYTLQYLREMTG